MRNDAPQAAGPGPAWREAQAYGFDMSLIEANLRRSPYERIRAGCSALALADKLRQAMKNRHG